MTLVTIRHPDCAILTMRGQRSGADHASSYFDHRNPVDVGRIVQRVCRRKKAYRDTRLRFWGQHARYHQQKQQPHLHDAGTRWHIKKQSEPVQKARHFQKHPRQTRSGLPEYFNEQRVDDHEHSIGTQKSKSLGRYQLRPNIWSDDDQGFSRIHSPLTHRLRGHGGDDGSALPVSRCRQISAFGTQRISRCAQPICASRGKRTSLFNDFRTASTSLGAPPLQLSGSD
jgi:hypothetical protein